MKKLLKETIITLFLAFILVNVISYFKKPDLQFESLPSMIVPTLSGDDFDTKNFKDKPIMIHFWATWCPTCKLEISNFNTLSQEFNLITIAVQSGDNEELKSFMKERDLAFPLINDRQGVLAQKFSINAYPTTLIFDKTGKVAFSEVGYSSTWGLKLRMWWLSLR